MSTPTVSNLKNTGYQQVTSSTKAPWQQELLSSLYGGSKGGIGAGLQNLSGLASGDQSTFDALSAPAWRDFNQAQGQIASRFSGMGSGARRSSGHMNAQSGAATDFAERLQSQRMGLQQNAIQQLLGLGQNLFNADTFDTHFLPKKKPFWQELLGSLGGGIGQGLGTAGGIYGMSKAGLF